MINLAGHPDPDPIIEEELFVAGIHALRNENLIPGEVKTHICGFLGLFSFNRFWYYWAVEGAVPLKAALEMYENEPYGRRDVRVGGHCGRISPLEYGVTYVDSDGKILRPLRSAPSKAERASKNPALQLVIAEILASERFVDDPAKHADRAYVDSYHIDSQGGLKSFVDTIRKYGLIGPYRG